VQKNKNSTSHESAEQHVKSMRRATRKQYSAEEKVRVMLEEILPRLPALARIGTEPLPKRFGTFVLGFESVPVRF
jgi:hypothetical protein